MLRVLWLGLLTGALCAWGQSPKYGVGHAPDSAELAAVDTAVLPDGTGLPEGKGTAAEGKAVYERTCQECHGDQAKGADQAALVGGIGSLATDSPKKTVGSYWPYATTVWDYVNRSMPFERPGSLSNDQVYAVVAYVLHLNGIIGENDELNAETLPKVEMPNRNGFVTDPRPNETAGGAGGGH